MRLKKWLLLLILFVFIVGCAAPTFKDGTTALNKGDYRTALKAFKPLAEKGDASAQYNLARMYNGGAGVKKDPEEALMWLRRAADNGHPEARSALAKLQQQEKGTNWGAWLLGIGLGAILLNSITSGSSDKDTIKHECDDFYSRSGNCGFHDDLGNWIRYQRLP